MRQLSKENYTLVGNSWWFHIMYLNILDWMDVPWIVTVDMLCTFQETLWHSANISHSEVSLPMKAE